MNLSNSVSSTIDIQPLKEDPLETSSPILGVPTLVDITPSSTSVNISSTAIPTVTTALAQDNDQTTTTTTTGEGSLMNLTMNSPIQLTPALATSEATACKYRTGKCTYVRAMKNNGELHALCEIHRSKANRNQRKYDLRKLMENGQQPTSTKRKHVTTGEEASVDVSASASGALLLHAGLTEAESTALNVSAAAAMASIVVGGPATIATTTGAPRRINKVKTRRTLTKTTATTASSSTTSVKLPHLKSLFPSSDIVVSTEQQPETGDEGKKAEGDDPSDAQAGFSNGLEALVAVCSTKSKSMKKTKKSKKSTAKVTTPPVKAPVVPQVETA